MSDANLHPILRQCLADAVCTSSLQTYESLQKASHEIENVHWHTPKMTSISIYALGAILLVATLLEALQHAARLRTLMRNDGKIAVQRDQK